LDLHSWGGPVGPSSHTDPVTGRGFRVNPNLGRSGLGPILSRLIMYQLTF
jgi:hypothetical protein